MILAKDYEHHLRLVTTAEARISNRVVRVVRLVKWMPPLRIGLKLTQMTPILVIQAPLLVEELLRIMMVGSRLVGVLILAIFYHNCRIVEEFIGAC